MPAALKEWALPIDQLGEGAQYYKHDPAQAKKLLAEAGYPNGFPATVSYTTYGCTILVDHVQLLLKYLKDIGIDAKPIQQEYGAYIAPRSTASTSPWPSARRRPSSTPTTILFGPYMPGELKNQSHVNDPVLTDLLVRQRRTADMAKRREVITTSSATPPPSSTTCMRPPASPSPSGTGRSRTTRPTSATTGAAG